MKQSSYPATKRGGADAGKCDRLPITRYKMPRLWNYLFIVNTLLLIAISGIVLRISELLR